MRLLWNSIRDRFHSLTIGQKFTSVVVIAALMPALIITSLLSGRIYNLTLSAVLSRNQEDISRIAPKIDQGLTEIASNSNILKKESYYKVLFSSSETDFRTDLSDETLRESFSNKAKDIISHSHIDHIHFYLNLPDNHPFFELSDPDLFYPISKVQGSYWHGIFKGSQLAELFCPAFYLSHEEKDKLGDMAYIIPVPCYNEEHTPIECYMAFYFTSSMLIELIHSNTTFPDAVSYIITDRDAEVTTTDSKLSGLYYESYNQIYNNLLSSETFIEKEILNETVYFNFKTISRPNWFLVSAIPKKTILQNVIEYDLGIFAITLLIFAVSMLLTIKLSRSLTDRITNVIKTMSKIREGQLVPMEEPDLHDEIGDLITTYNYMTRQQKNLTEDLKKTADELRVAEVNALQAQINPHFLYNTLDTIHWMAVSGKTEDISSMVHNLSKFYKLTLGKDMTNTTIEKEIEQVAAYVDLQNVRFNNAIDLIVDIPEELCSCRIPRLTLQPIVENAILHGIREKDSKAGTVIITGWIEPDVILLQISDDGIGMQEEILPKLLSKEGVHMKTTGTNIAIFNVHHRLQLLYGPDYGLSYQSRLGEGTDVNIRLPLNRE